MHPMVYIFMAFIVMLLIPNYPYLIPCFFVCNGLFYAFQQAVMNNDLNFSAMLPVSKRQTVKAKFISVFIVQLIMLALYALMILIKSKLDPQPNLFLDACPTLIGGALVTFGVFNCVFLSCFFKTGVKAARSFLIASIVTFIWIFAFEGFFVFAGSAKEASGLAAWAACTLDCIPKEPSVWSAQLCAIAVGAIVYALLMLIGYSISARRFERVDL